MEEQLLKGHTLLVVDDEVDLRDIVASELEFMGAKVFQAENVAMAREFLNKEKIDVIISDIRMPGGTGIDLLDHIKSKDVINPPIILITGFADITVENAFDKGAEALVNKPFKLDDLIHLAEKHSQPLKDRFSDNADSQKTIEISYSLPMLQEFKSGNCLLGRGGIALNLENPGKFEVGEVVKFTLHFQDKTFAGVGICRWYKTPENDANKTAIGLEFVCLKDEALTSHLEFIESQKPTAFIPALR